ncbi:MAG: hypothetical protein A3F84_20775 [Candidatus Handelsmanbacteria bacterium RIFCSPLOWO2_12_FULL_64_10]|uniref:Uncharacterized protein n=1 Tax=Handelsmanbacteria sp. (strain RIFCSPLOWO2_12_FULL_64_10) TaxID=1817868 RepID=A0A1F6CW12_HANXR|nr:MAG: hypothetical protein A3F84_20775 [Candidatus Handelsmanbacteria bacterium RIFCSPLOWO2_12_FULL_64_10]
MPEKLITLVPTLFVGLGGTGQNIVGRLKRKIDAQFRGVDNLPIHYLCIDTDSPQRTRFRFRPDEFIEISNFDGAAVLNNLGRYPAIESWWPKSLKAGDVGNVDFGAGQTRPVGRMAFYYWYNQTIKEALERKAKELTVIRSASEMQKLEAAGLAVEPNTVAVYVVSSLGGGTGSGIFFDIAFELRNHLRLRKGVEMNGIFTMPEGYIRVVPKGMQSERVQANTYAALKEIDHYADADHARGLTLQFSTQARAFNPEGPIFDMISLLDIIDKGGNELDSIDQLYNMISTKLALELFVAGDRRSALRNVKIRREFSLGKRRLYDSFGVGALEFHAHNMVTYCRLRLAEEILGELTRPLPPRQEVKNWLMRNELQEHGADMVLNKFRRSYDNVFTALIPVTPQETDKASLEIQKVMDQVGKKFEAVKKTVETRCAAVGKEAVAALRHELAEWRKNSSVSVRFIADFLTDLRRYATALSNEMEKEKKETNLDNVRGRMDEARNAVKDAETGVWLPVLKKRNITQRFQRWFSATRAWTKAACETLARIAAMKIYAELVDEIDKQGARHKRLVDLLSDATWEANQQAEKELERVQTEIEGSFKLIEGVVDASRIEGTDETRFDVAYKEFKPRASLMIEDLLKTTDNLGTLLDSPPDSAARVLDDVVLPVLEETFRKIYEMDVLTAVGKYNKTFDVQKAVTNIVRNLKPFLSVDPEALGEDRRPEHMIFVGVPDAQNRNYTELLTEDKLGVSVAIVQTGDPSRIIAMTSEVGYPSYLLNFVRDYRHYYQEFEKRRGRGEPECVHLDGRWNQDTLPDLVPAELEK